MVPVPHLYRMAPRAPDGPGNLRAQRMGRVSLEATDLPLHTLSLKPPEQMDVDIAHGQADDLGAGLPDFLQDRSERRTLLSPGQLNGILPQQPSRRAVQPGVLAMTVARARVIAAGLDPAATAAKAARVAGPYVDQVTWNQTLSTPTAYLRT